MWGTPLLMAKKKGMIIPVLACAVGMKDALRSVKELPLPSFPKLIEGWKTATTPRE